MKKIAIKLVSMGALVAMGVGCAQLPTTDIQGYKGGKSKSSGISQRLDQNSVAVGGDTNSGALNGNAIAVNLASQRAKGSNIDQDANQNAVAVGGDNNTGFVNGNAIAANALGQRARGKDIKQDADQNAVAVGGDGYAIPNDTTLNGPVSGGGNGNAIDVNLGRQRARNYR